VSDESLAQVPRSVVIAACASMANVLASLATVVQLAKSLHSAKKFARKGAVATAFAKSANASANRASAEKIALSPQGKCALEKATAMVTVNASTAYAFAIQVGLARLAT